MTARETVRLGLIAVSRAPVTRWGVRGFAPRAVLEAVPETAPWTRLGPVDAVEDWYAGAADLTLHPGESGHYADNLAAGRPALWAALTPGAPFPEIAGLTADPYEGEAWAGDPGRIVEALAMPPGIAGWIAGFVARLPPPPPFEKRARRPADPEALARRGPGAGGRGRTP